MSKPNAPRPSKTPHYPFGAGKFPGIGGEVTLAIAADAVKQLGEFVRNHQL